MGVSQKRGDRRDVFMTAAADRLSFYGNFVGIVYLSLSVYIVSQNFTAARVAVKLTEIHWIHRSFFIFIFGRIEQGAFLPVSVKTHERYAQRYGFRNVSRCKRNETLDEDPVREVLSQCIFPFVGQRESCRNFRGSYFAARKQVGESVARPAWYYQQNIGGLANMLLAMEGAGVGQMIFSSSAAVPM